MTQTVKRSGSHGWRNRNKDPEEEVRGCRYYKLWCSCDGIASLEGTHLMMCSYRQKIIDLSKIDQWFLLCPYFNS